MVIQLLLCCAWARWSQLAAPPSVWQTARPRPAKVSARHSEVRSTGTKPAASASQAPQALTRPHSPTTTGDHSLRTPARKVTVARTTAGCVGCVKGLVGVLWSPSIARRACCCCWLAAAGWLLRAVRSTLSLPHAALSGPARATGPPTPSLSPFDCFG